MTRNPDLDCFTIIDGDYLPLTGSQTQSSSRTIWTLKTAFPGEPLTPEMTSVRINNMIPRTKAANKFGFRYWAHRALAASVAVLLLSVQIGLACHCAAHIHEVGENGDCSLCDLGSHFAAEPALVQDLDPASRTVFLPPWEFLLLSDSPVQAHFARGPPAVSL